MEITTVINKYFIENDIKTQDEYLLDGAIHRFDTERDNDKNGWYVFHSECIKDSSVVYGAYGDWKKGVSFTFHYITGRPLSKNVINEIKKKAEKKRREVENENHIKAIKIAEKTLSLLKGSTLNNTCSYLESKKIPLIKGVYIKDDTLYIPLYDITGTVLKSFQKIEKDGYFDEFKKRYIFGSELKGSYHIINRELLTSSKIVYVCEGFATGVSIAESLDNKFAVVCSMSAYSLKRAVSDVRTMSKAKVIVVADNDITGVGIAKANKSGADRVILIPRVSENCSDANDYVNTCGLGSLRELIRDNKDERIRDIVNEINDFKSISWLIKGLLEKETVSMIYGASNSAKTFIALDMMLSIATNIDFLDLKQTSLFYNGKEPSVLYLCGESANGVKGRIKVWEKEKGIKIPKGRFYWLTDNFEFDSESGINELVSDIDDLGIAPDMIVIDTLSVFQSGDESNGIDAKRFIANCKLLKNRYKSNVCIIHHTGWVKKDEKVHSRGSSNFRGDLDTLLYVEKDDESGKITLHTDKQRNADKCEDIYMSLKKVGLGIFDEFGEEITSAVIEKWEDSDTKNTTNGSESEENEIKITNKKEKNDLMGVLDSIIDDYGYTVEKEKFKELLMSKLGVGIASFYRYISKNYIKEHYRIDINFKEILNNNDGKTYIQIVYENDIINGFPLIDNVDNQG